MYDFVLNNANDISYHLKPGGDVWLFAAVVIY
jgi:hypothetical protein